MKTIIHSSMVQGLKAHGVDIEVDISQRKKESSLGYFRLIGLTNPMIPQTKQRVIMALKACDVDISQQCIFVNAAPANLKKEESHYDLAIAIGILQALGTIITPFQFINETLIVGELSIHGNVKPIHGILVIAYEAKSMGKKRIIVPEVNAQEAGLIAGIEVIGISSLDQFISYIKKEINIKPTITNFELLSQHAQSEISIDDIKGQDYAKRALQIAAAGRHNILFFGSPGSGKTMLAQRLTTLMPPMCFEEIIDTTKIYSIAGKLNNKSLMVDRPFRNPHHSTGRASLIGGGTKPLPGEISLAHHGVLFLDEFPEFRREALEGLREPMESKFANISRTQISIQYPSNFLLVAAFNPCPCGFYGDPLKKCICSDIMRINYRNRLSGPLLDRIDLHIGIKSVSYKEATDENTSPTITSKKLILGIMNAKKMQSIRYNSDIKTNNIMTSKDIDNYCKLDSQSQEIVERFFQKHNLTMRSYHKTLKIARTIADLDQSNTIEIAHIKEAFMYKFDNN